jgi:MOSC domain-containing protein YiiM
MEGNQVNSSGRIHKISFSSEKGVKKNNIEHAILQKDFGILGDAHAGSQRQVSLLPFESFDKVKNDIVEIKPGDFAENITTTGLKFDSVAIGQTLAIGCEIKLEITQIGKECHHGCYIREIVGDCIMPREGIFAKVVRGGAMKVGDKIRWVS